MTIHFPEYRTVDLRSAERAEWLANLDLLRANGEHPTANGSAVTLRTTALDLLADHCGPDDDGHYDGRHIWIGGSEYEVVRAVLATVNVTTGALRVEVPDGDDTDVHHVGDGRTVGLTDDLDPWGADEEDMDRADKALADLGWRRIGDWSDLDGAMERSATVTLA